jgi:hypothetical protein
VAIKAELDRNKLERSMKQFSAAFGHTTAQAVCRWAVRTCAELAFETQAWGKSQTKKTQTNAILRDASNVVFSASRIKRKGANSLIFMPHGGVFSVPNDRVLNSADEINEWIELNRTRRRSRTAKLPNDLKKVCTLTNFKKAMAVRNARAGMAKGAWIGAGNDIAKAQSGEAKETIGVGFLKYTQKHQHLGSSKRPKEGWRPAAGITSKVAYSGQVISSAGMKKAVNFGLSKALKQYKFAMKALDKKK